MKIKKSNERGFVVFVLDESIDLFKIPHLKELLLNEIDKDEPKKIVFNLGEVNYMDSAVLGLFVLIFKKYIKKSDVRFCNLSTKAQKAFHLTAFDQFFNIDATEEESLGFYNRY